MNNDVVDLRSVVRSLNLTEWGALTLSAFPLEAIQWADKNFFRGNSKSEPFKRFTNLCVEWCNQSNVKPEWRLMYEQQRMLGMPHDAPMVQERARPSLNKFGRGSRNDQIRDQKREKQTDETTTTPKVHYGGYEVVMLSDDEFNARCAAFVTNDECVAGIDKLAKLIGHEDAKKYFTKVFDNLKYEVIHSDNNQI